jgi:hypothetical protein
VAILAVNGVAANATIDSGCNCALRTTAAFTNFHLLRFDVKRVGHPYDGFNLVSLVRSGSLPLTVERKVRITKMRARVDKYIRIC